MFFLLKTYNHPIVTVLKIIKTNPSKFNDIKENKTKEQPNIPQLPNFLSLVQDRASTEQLT